MTAVHQDSLLINTFTNDLAIVPDLFATFPYNRKRGFDDEDLLDILYEQSPVGQQPAKRHCAFPTYTQLGSNYQLTSLELGTNSMQREKTHPSLSFVSIPANELKQNQKKVVLSIVEEPEQFYRARYDSEGVRAPLKGINENYPTVEIRGENIKQAVITVKLVHEDGSTHTCCSLDSSEDRKKALVKRVVPGPTSNSVRAEFEDLRIRREKKKEGRKSASSVEKSATRDGKYDKMAFLLFNAEVDTNHGHVNCSVISSPISLTAAPEPAELDWLVPTRGHFGGKEVVAIKGSKMTSPKVLFRIRGINGELVELPGSVDKEKSHQNVLLVRTPNIDHHSFGLSHQRIEASVVVITGRTQMCSNSLDFEFIPNDICRECMQETPMKTVPSSSTPCHSTGSTLGMGMSPCSPMPSSSPGIQPSPRPVYSPSYVQGGLSSPPSNSPYHDQLDIVSLPSVQSVHGPIAVPPVSGESTSMQAVISLTSCESFETYSSTPHSGMPKEKDIMQIVEHLLSPPGSAPGSAVSESGTLPHYPEVMPLYSNSPCDPSSPEAPSVDTIGRVEEALFSLRKDKRITEGDFMYFMNECKRYNVDLLKAYSVASGDLLTFEQQLASIKPPISYHSTHQ